MELLRREQGNQMLRVADSKFTEIVKFKVWTMSCQHAVTLFFILTESVPSLDEMIPYPQSTWPK